MPDAYRLDGDTILNTAPGEAIVLVKRKGAVAVLTLASGATIEDPSGVAWAIFDQAAGAAGPARGPGFPVEVPPGFGPSQTEYPATAVGTVSGRVVALDIGPNHGKAVVVVMTGLSLLDFHTWEPRPGGDDVFFFGLDTRRAWSLRVNEDVKDLDVDARGRAWAFVKGPRVWAFLSSREKP
jgi:hypothetical protein